MVSVVVDVVGVGVGVGVGVVGVVVVAVLLLLLSFCFFGCVCISNDGVVGGDASARRAPRAVCRFLGRDRHRRRARRRAPHAAAGGGGWPRLAVARAMVMSCDTLTHNR